MAQFTVRVELHRADEFDYETLHTSMENAGFSRLITSSEGVTYHLPTAEYNKSGNFTSEQVLNAAKLAAAQTRRDASILVTQSEGRRWLNLEAA